MPQSRDYATPQERLADQDWAGTARHVSSSLTPADKGWILGFVLIFGIFQVTNFLEHKSRTEGEVARSQRLENYMTAIVNQRGTIEEHRSEEIRRCQEVIKEMAQTVSRQANRVGRTEAVKAQTEQ